MIFIIIRFHVIGFYACLNLRIKINTNNNNNNNDNNQKGVSEFDLSLFSRSLYPIYNVQKGLAKRLGPQNCVTIQIAIDEKLGHSVMGFHKPPGRFGNFSTLHN